MADVDPSLWDLQRLIERNHQDSREDILDLKSQLARSTADTDEKFRLYLLREVFEAKEAAHAAREQAMLQRIGVLEEGRKSDKSQIRGAIVTAVASVVATIVAAVLLAAILGGGKP
ncbi:hypothetical protein [Actinomadura luteofluorescens]|uniref:hypothetical protein n=1 Tax=Actinomadura luteofluorescens TaxID=46163 RepID=UPI003D8B6274